VNAEDLAEEFRRSAVHVFGTFTGHIPVSRRPIPRGRMRRPAWAVRQKAWPGRSVRVHLRADTAAVDDYLYRLRRRAQ